MSATMMRELVWWSYPGHRCAVIEGYRCIAQVAEQGYIWRRLTDLTEEELLCLMKHPN